ncbi:D-alanine--D-alanine ligase [Dirofilaria immitis]
MPFDRDDLFHCLLSISDRNDETETFMAKEKSGDNIPKMMVDHDTSDTLYQDNMDVASEVLETYFHQQQRQPENSVHLRENALPGEQREMLEIRSNPEDSGIFTTNSDEINSDEVTVTTNSPQNRTDSTIEEKISNEEKMAIAEKMSLDQQNELDSTSIKINVIRHQTEMMNNRKPKLIADTDGNGSAVHTDSNDLLQSSDNTSEESNSTHHMLTRSAAKAVKSTFHSAENEKIPRKRKKSGVNLTSNGGATSARSVRTSSSAKKLSKKPRCSRAAHK